MSTLKISGSGNAPGGEYDIVNISGSGRVDGSLTAREISISGSGRIEGTVAAENLSVSGSGKMRAATLTGTFRTSGSTTLSGPLVARDVHVSGVSDIDGDVTAETEVHTSGSLRVHGALRAQEIKISGILNVENGIETEKLRVSGNLDARGLVNAEICEISLYGQSRVEELGGNDIRVERSTKGGILNMLGIMTGRFTALLIEGSRIKLEYTRCETVRGEDIVIGQGCEIGRVEYRNSLSVHPDARVGEQTKID